MAGGAGERFWPLSRIEYPKQLLRITENRSMLSMALERIRPVVALEDTFVITSANLVSAIRADLPALPAENVLGEPAGRNTAACLAFGAVCLAEKYGEDVLTMVLTADHFVGDTATFAARCEDALSVASQQDVLVLMGRRPDRPETGYGYIELGARVDASPNYWRCRSFREKPNEDMAREYLQSGNFFWNLGLFAWKNSVLTRSLHQHLPETRPAMDALATAWRVCDNDALTEAFLTLPKISIDYGVLERSPDVAVVEADFTWDDIGTWGSLARMLPEDQDGNTRFGNAVVLESKNTMVYAAEPRAANSTEPLVVAYGLRDVVVVSTGDAVLVLPSDRLQEVRSIVAALREQGHEDKL